MWSEATSTGVKRTAIRIPTPHYWCPSQRCEPFENGRVRSPRGDGVVAAGGSRFRERGSLGLQIDGRVAVGGTGRGVGWTLTGFRSKSQPAAAKMNTTRRTEDFKPRLSLTPPI